MKEKEGRKSETYKLVDEKEMLQQLKMIMVVIPPAHIDLLKLLLPSLKRFSENSKVILSSYPYFLLPCPPSLLCFIHLFLAPFLVSFSRSFMVFYRKYTRCAVGPIWPAIFAFLRKRKSVLMGLFFLKR